MSDITIGQKSPAHMTAEEDPFLQVNRCSRIMHPYYHV